MNPNFKWIVVEDIGRTLNPVGYGFRSPILRPTRFPVETINQLLNISGVERMYQIYEKKDGTLDPTLRVKLTKDNFREPFEVIWKRENPDKIFPWENEVEVKVPENPQQQPPQVQKEQKQEPNILSDINVYGIAPTDTSDVAADQGIKLEDMSNSNKTIDADRSDLSIDQEINKVESDSVDENPQTVTEEDQTKEQEEYSDKNNSEQPSENVEEQEEQPSENEYVKSEETQQFKSAQSTTGKSLRVTGSKTYPKKQSR